VRGTCENVTFFFSFKVIECYDCFYLNSFISDTTFSFKPGHTVVQGPPCCSGSVPSQLGGQGKDSYYMTLVFDNTQNNPYLQAGPDGTAPNPAYVGYQGGPYPGILGLMPNNGVQFDPTVINPLVQPFLLASLDGNTPDFFIYKDKIISQLGTFSPNEVRITLHGIVGYKWTLRQLNSTDLVRDFVGTANYNATGYGFIGLFCGLLNGSVGIAESIVSSSKFCADLPWNGNSTPDDSWYGVGYDALGNSADRTTTDSPVNLPVDLTYHVYQDVEYHNVQWATPPGGLTQYPPPFPTGLPIDTSLIPVGP
jgi:hypothetical protein